MRRTKRIKVFVSVGSHGLVFVFGAGPVAARYPGLMHVFYTKHPGLIPATLTYAVPQPAKGR